MAHQFVAMEAAPLSRIEEHGFDRRLYFGRADYAGPGPQIYVNTLDPGVELAAHFHKVDQFQVFFGTPGSSFKRREISPVMVHYTDAYSTYGPFRAADDRPLRYATIRAESSNFGGVMPAARRELIARGRRSKSVAVDHATLADVPGRGESSTTEIIGQESDGLAATLLLLGPEASLVVSMPARSSGRAWVVVAGGIMIDESVVSADAIGWSSNSGDDVAVTAAATGAVVLLLDFPDPPTNSAVHASREE